MDGSITHLGRQMAPRRATVADVPFLVETARAAYPAYDLSQAAQWAAAAVASSNIALFICDDVVGIASVQIEFWRPGKVVADLIQLYRGCPGAGKSLGAGRPLYAVLVACAEWARSRGAYLFRFGSSVDLVGAAGGFDVLAPLARRLRAKPLGVTYAMEL